MVESSVPDLVDTATTCAERGLHVHMVKPAGTNLNAYKKFLDIAKDKKLVFQRGYMYRYNAGISYVLNKAKRGELGRIYNITADHEYQASEVVQTPTFRLRRGLKTTQIEERNYEKI